MKNSPRCEEPYNDDDIIFTEQFVLIDTPPTRSYNPAPFQRFEASARSAS